MKVKFLPENVELEIKPNQSVMNLAHENNIHIKSVCKGIPSCAECRVKLVDGEHNVLPPSPAETNLIGTAWFVDGRRLSCQLRCFGDITVDLSEQIEKASEAVKKPRGRYQKEGESAAVLGNVMDQSMEDRREREAQQYLDREEQLAEIRRIREQIKTRRKQKRDKED